MKVNLENGYNGLMRYHDITKADMLHGDGRRVVLWVEGIKLPKRATRGSAGYDFFAPVSFTLAPGEMVKIPTGVRVEMAEDWVLCLYPRSGLGFKYRLQLNNTVGIIDSDYFYSDNEGHMFMKLTNDSKEGKTLEVGQSEGMVQGIFMQYGITEDDDADGVRNGGFGSTTGK